MEKTTKKAIYLPKKETIAKMVKKATNNREEQFYIIHEDKHLVVDLEQLNFISNEMELNPRIIGSVSYSDNFEMALPFFSYQQQ